MKNSISILMIILFSNFSNAQSQNYETLWKDVAKLEAEGLPKSALEVLETIDKQAESSKNQQQIIKVMLFKSKFAMLLEEEDAQLSIINNFKTKILESEFPTKNILENILANLYWQIFSAKQMEILQPNKNKYKS